MYLGIGSQDTYLVIKHTSSDRISDSVRRLLRESIDLLVSCVGGSTFFKGIYITKFWSWIPKSSCFKNNEVRFYLSKHIFLG